VLGLDHVLVGMGVILVGGVELQGQADFVHYGDLVKGAIVTPSLEKCVFSITFDASVTLNDLKCTTA